MGDSAVSADCLNARQNLIALCELGDSVYRSPAIFFLFYFVLHQIF